MLVVTRFLKARGFVTIILKVSLTTESWVMLKLCNLLSLEISSLTLPMSTSSSFKMAIGQM